MAKVFGHVREMEGDFFVRSPDATIRKLEVGDEVCEDDTLFGSQENSRYDTLCVSLDEGLPFDVLVVGDESQCFDASLSAHAFSEDETTVSIDSLLAFSDEFTPRSPDTPDGSERDEIEEVSAQPLDDEIMETSEHGPSLDANDENSTVEEVEEEGPDELAETTDQAVALDTLIEHTEEVTISVYAYARLANEAAQRAFKSTDEGLSSDAERFQNAALEASRIATEAATKAREAADKLEALASGVTARLPESISRANMAANSAENAAINAFNASLDTQNSAEGSVAMLTQSVQDAADAANIAARQTQEAAIVANNLAVTLLESPDAQKIAEAIASKRVAKLRSDNAAASAAVAESVADRAELVGVSQEMITNARNAADNAESASVNARQAAEDSQTLIETIIASQKNDASDELGREVKQQIPDVTAIKELQGIDKVEEEVQSSEDIPTHHERVDQRGEVTEKDVPQEFQHAGEILLSKGDTLFGGRRTFTISIDLDSEHMKTSTVLPLIRQYDAQSLDLYLQIDGDGKIRYGEIGLDDHQHETACEMVSEQAIELKASHNIMVVKEENTVMVLVDGTLLFLEESMTQSLRKGSDVDIVIADSRSSGEQGGVVTRVRLFDTALSMIEIAAMVSGSDMPSGIMADIAFDAKMPSLDSSGNGHDAYVLEAQSIIELIASSQDDLATAAEGL